MQDATVGFLQAVKKFDPARGVAFTTYLTPWLRKYTLMGAERAYRTASTGRPCPWPRSRGSSA